MTTIEYVKPTLYRESMPASAIHSTWGTRLPGQSQEGYGKKITTPHMVKTPGSNKWRRVYATCFSNTASHWIICNTKKLHLDVITWDEIPHEERGE